MKDGYKGKGFDQLNAHEEEETQSNNKTVIIVIISLLIGFAIGWFSASSSATPVEVSGGDEVDTNSGEVVTGEDSSEGTTSEAGSEDTTGVVTSTSGTYAVAVNNQEAGARVALASVELAHEGWIAIYEDAGGVPGSILGARYLPAGTHSGLSIELQRGTEANGTYYVMVHRDDGVVTERGSHVFDISVDTPRTVSGTTVLATFVATAPVPLGN